MKKVVFILMAVLAASVGTAQIKFDADGLLKKLADNDVTIQNPKKNIKPTVWIERGNILYQLGASITDGLYPGLAEAELILICGKPEQTETKTLEKVEYKVFTYPYYNVFLGANGAVAFWDVTKTVKEGALDQAYEAYMKAYELDPKSVDKVKEGITKIANAYRGMAQNDFLPIQKYAEAAISLGKSFDYNRNPIVNVMDTVSAYNAGYIATVLQDYNLALKYLNEAEKLGYEKDGELYYLQFFAYQDFATKTLNEIKELQSQIDEILKIDSTDTAKTTPLRAKIKEKEKIRDGYYAQIDKVLSTGLAKYPTHKQLSESRIQFYMSSGRDMQTILTELDKALAIDPQNFGLYFNKGIIYDKLKKSDEAIAAFKKAAELAPNDYGVFFNIGIIYVRQADALIPELEKIPYSDQEKYDAMVKKIKELKRSSIEYFEKAHALQPTEKNIVDILKSLYFLFRDENAETMQKYEKYDALLKSM